MKRTANRDFNVEYFEKEGDIWIAKSQLRDDEHDIELEVEIDMLKMIILDAKIKFNRFPMENCRLIEDKAKQMRGLRVDNEFIRNAMKIFMGPEGCPNIMSLLHISIPGIIYYYYPYKIRTGKMKGEEFDTIIRTELKNACIAHTLL